MIIAFIPARCGSKSIPFKNIKKFSGKPLIYWSLKALENSITIDKIFVATDCNEIKNTVSTFGFSKVSVYDRDLENANDVASTESVMLEFISKNNFCDDDIFILVQATSPLTQTKDFNNALIKYKNEKYDSLLSCVNSKRFFWDFEGNPINYNYKNRPRRQDFDGIFMENGAFYINTVGNIKREKNRLSGKIGIYEMEAFTAIELDEPDDWYIAEKMMQKYINPTEPKKRIKLFLCDVDGTLTDAGMYYSSDGVELKKFSTYDGKGFELLRKAGIKTGIITSENTKIVENRAKKLKVDYLYQGLEHKGKCEIAKEICRLENIDISEVAYVGDDINCKELLEEVGLAACPANAIDEVKKIPNIIQLTKKGGEGAVREFIQIIL